MASPPCIHTMHLAACTLSPLSLLNPSALEAVVSLPAMQCARLTAAPPAPFLPNLPQTTVEDLDELSSLLQVPLVAGTVNRGSDVIGAGAAGGGARAHTVGPVAASCGAAGA